MTIVLSSLSFTRSFCLLTYWGFLVYISNYAGSCKMVEWKLKWFFCIIDCLVSVQRAFLLPSNFWGEYHYVPKNLFKFSVLNALTWTIFGQLVPSSLFMCSSDPFSLWTFLWLKLSKAHFVQSLPHPGTSHFFFSLYVLLIWRILHIFWVQALYRIYG